MWPRQDASELVFERHTLGSSWRGADQNERLSAARFVEAHAPAALSVIAHDGGAPASAGHLVAFAWRRCSPWEVTSHFHHIDITFTSNLRHTDIMLSSSRLGRRAHYARNSYDYLCSLLLPLRCRESYDRNR